MKIDKGIPLAPFAIKKTKYPWRDMEAGDSFFVATETASIHTLRSAANQAARYHKTGYAVRSVGGGCRVWRTK
jgi:hypothetical protein